MNLRDEINKLKAEGYNQQNAQARICQDIILEAISKCHFNENVTIKGGVVMRNISNDVRRATVDLDFDFIKKYPTKKGRKNLPISYFLNLFPYL